MLKTAFVFYSLRTEYIKRPFFLKIKKLVVSTDLQCIFTYGRSQYIWKGSMEKDIGVRYRMMNVEYLSFFFSSFFFYLSECLVGPCRQYGQLPTK